MQTSTISATALENLKRSAKKHRDITGQSLAQSLDAVARHAGYVNWKYVTTLASTHAPSLMPALHSWRTHWVRDGSPRQRNCTTVEDLCQVLGGVEPVLLRSHCHRSSPGARCLCELDPFVTAKRANVGIDIGDRHDFWNYLYLPERPFSTPNIVNVRINLGLGSHGQYLNEHLLTDREDHRCNSLNPNSDAYRQAMNNHANQLNPNNN